MKFPVQKITSERDISSATQTLILLTLATAWLLFCFSSGKIQSFSWYPLLVVGRTVLCIAALLTAWRNFKLPSWLVITRYMLACLLAQSIFGILEPANSLEFYQYCPYFLFIAAWSFSGTLYDWIVKYFPIALLGLAVPLFFKDQSLFLSLGKFLFEFTTTVVMVFLSFAAVISSSRRYRILMQNLELREKLLAAEKFQKLEIEREVGALRVQIEKDSRSRAYARIAEHVFHDVRAPLAMIKTVVKLAEEETVGPYSKFLHLGIERMESIVDDLADKGKIEPESNFSRNISDGSSLSELVTSVVNEKNLFIILATG